MDDADARRRRELLEDGYRRHLMDKTKQPVTPRTIAGWEAARKEIKEGMEAAKDRASYFYTATGAQYDDGKYDAYVEALRAVETKLDQLKEQLRK